MHKPHFGMTQKEWDAFIADIKRVNAPDPVEPEPTFTKAEVLALIGEDEDLIQGNYTMANVPSIIRNELREQIRTRIEGDA